MWFLIFTIPQTLILVFAFDAIFKYAKNHYLSKFIRRYCFKAVIIQMMFEGNISYFTFLFFNQMITSFSFKQLDRFAI